MRRFAVAAALLLAACRPVVQPTYLYVWAGDSAETASDFTRATAVAIGCS